MPSLGSALKSKNKQKDARQRSRNTTPISVANHAVGTPPTTPFLTLDTAKLLVASKPSYADILDQLDTKPSNLDPKQLLHMIEELKQLSDAAEKRVDSCEKALRLIHEHQRNAEPEIRQVDSTRKGKLKREESSQKNIKAKKRKDRSDAVDSIEIKREDDAPRSKNGRFSVTPNPTDTPSPSKRVKHSPGTSSLSDVAESPKAEAASRASPAQSDVSIEENRILHQAPVVPPGGFFPDPLAPDPVIYHIREITPGMSEEEKKEIYSVASYPTVDLSDQIAGVPPDKDFSNAKPSQQISAATFAAFAEPYVRPLAEEDMAFLRERGDRVTPFLAVPRNKKTWTEIWAEEDNHTMKENVDRTSTSQPRGNFDQIDESTVDTDLVSTGPLASRLLSLLKFEHRPTPKENNGPDGSMANGDDTMDLDFLNPIDVPEKPIPSATSISELVSGSKSSQKLDYIQSDDRIRAELRYLGLLGQDDNPDYDAHHDDDISERLRLLQAELRRIMIINAARKARLADLAKARLAYQEYSTILDDLDSQVQQAYLKRTRTLGKTKKGGGSSSTTAGAGTGAAGGGLGSHRPRAGLHATTGLGVSRTRDIGDNARMLMERRKKWQNCLGVPLFKDLKTGIPGKGETIWEPHVMEGYEKAELEALEEEGE